MFLFLLLLLPRIIFPFCCVTFSWVCPTREWWKVKRDTRQKILNWVECFIIAFISFLDASTNFRQRRFIVPPVHCEDVSINCDAWEWSAWNLSLVVGGEIHKSVQPKTMIRAVFVWSALPISRHVRVRQFIFMTISFDRILSHLKFKLFWTCSQVITLLICSLLPPDDLMPKFCKCAPVWAGNAQDGNRKTAMMWNNQKFITQLSLIKSWKMCARQSFTSAKLLNKLSTLFFCPFTFLLIHYTARGSELINLIIFADN